MAEQALSGMKIIEYGEGVCAPYCAKLLGDFGAEVIKIEEPGIGDAARRMGPFLNDTPDPECSGLFLYCNTSKRGVTLNMRDRDGRAIFHELLKGEVPPKVVIDEAVQLAHWFGGAKAPGFVNGVLDRVAHSLGRL